MILEIDFVPGLKVEISTESDIEYLQISGLCMHSSLVVTRITEKVKDDEMLILVKLGLARKGYSGSFCYRVRLDENINIVKFGNEKAVIWTRDESVRF